MDQTMSAQTIENRVMKGDDEGISRGRQIANRTEDLNSYGRAGYVLVHTAVIDGTDYVTFVDTLTRVNQ